MKGATLTILVIDGDQILVKYKSGNAEECIGTNAANGTVFIANYWKLIKMTSSTLEKSWETYELEYATRLYGQIPAHLI